MDLRLTTSQQPSKITQMMRTLRFAFYAIAAMILQGCMQSLYVTETGHLEDKAGYVPVLSYYAVVGTRVSVAIVPPAPPKDGAPQGLPTLTVTLVPVPTLRANLYMKKNSFFSNTFNVSTGSDGLLSSSDSTSVQQVTNILTELAQTAAVFVAPRAPGGEVPSPPVVSPPPPPPSDDRAYCAQGVSKLTASTAFYWSGLVGGKSNE